MRILFITANRIGDAVLSLGLLAWLVEQYTDARFTIAAGPVTADLFRAVPRLDKLIQLRKRPFNLHWITLWQDCRKTEWDLIVDLRNSFVSRLLPAKRRAYRPARQTGQHKVLDNALALKLPTPPLPHIWLDDAAETTAARLVTTNAPILALGPAANWPAKQWSGQRFIQLVHKLTSADGALPGARVLVVAAPHEREQLTLLLQALPASQLIDVIGHDLLTVAACLKRCRLFIGNDSGLMHMAATMGVPTLGLFGPGYEKIYGPWGKNTAVVRTPESTAELLSYLPYPGAFHPNLMNGLTVESVYEAANQLLSLTNQETNSFYRSE